MQNDASSVSALEAVQTRYAAGARARAPELCCPVDYDASLLEVLPSEIIERDYGCGDPSRFVRPGETVLDLGSGGGKICYMASQIVGAEGRVIGVDATEDMLALARKWRTTVGDRIGWHNVEFRRGHIQDLGLDRDELAQWLLENPVSTLADFERMQAEMHRLRATSPMIADGSIDVVLSNCVLNLVDNRDKQRLFEEIHRVLKRGGRCAISDIVSDEDVPEPLRQDAELWSGCISGAMREDRFVRAFADAGLHGVEIAEYQSEPWAIVQGIEFRSITVTAHKGKAGPCWEHGEAVIYNGPWSRVVDDDGHVFERGRRSAVCRKTFELMTREPYRGAFTPVEPSSPIDPADAVPFDCAGTPTRDPRETKRGVRRADVTRGACCAPGECDQ